MESDLGKLFIGGISWDTDEERLRDYFSNYGDVVEAVIMRDRSTGRARGFGFIVFSDPRVAERVITDKHIIDGRTVEAKKAVPRDDQQQVLKRHTSPVHFSIRTKKIFVGGLPSSITEEEFKSYFDQFGTISDVVVMYDHTTQRPRGFGFITFDTEDAIDRVLHKTFHELNGKVVEVKRAVPKEVSPNNRSPLLLLGGGNGFNRISNNSYFNNFAPGLGYYNNIGSVNGRFSPVIGSGRNQVSSFGLNHEPVLSLNPSYDGTFGYNRVQSNTYFNNASAPNRYTSPIGHNRTESPYVSNNRDLWGLPSSLAVGNNNNNNNNSYRRNTWIGSGLNGFEGSIEGLYRGNSVYSDSTWQNQQIPVQSSHEIDGLGRSYGYGMDNVDLEPSANESEGYSGSYIGGNRETNRGIAA